MAIRLNPEKIQLTWFGGVPVVFSSAHQENGDYANVAFVSMKSPSKRVQDGDYLMIEMNSNFRSTSNLAVLKDYLRADHKNVIFADECQGGAMVNVQDIIKECDSSGLKIQSYEMDVFVKDKCELHRVTCLAMAHNLDPYAWMDVFKYDLDSGRLYPYMSVYKAICNILSTRNQPVAA